MPEDTVSVRSTAPTPINIGEGFVVKGTNDPAARGGVAVTHGVLRSVFDAWKAKMGPQSARDAVPARDGSEALPARPELPAHELHGMLTAEEPPREPEPAAEPEHEEGEHAANEGTATTGAE